MTAHASAAWQLVQIAELVRRAEELHLRAMNLLPPESRADMPQGATASMPAAEIEQLATAAAEGAEIAEQIRQFAQTLPDEDVEISYEDVREAAAADLARGMLDAERVIVIACLLDVATGWPALAETAARHRHPRELDRLDAGTDALRLPRRRQTARHPRAQLADIPTETAYADCTAEQLARLADAIDELGRAWRS